MTLGGPGTQAKTPTLYGIPNCDTVKRARAWFRSQGVVLDFHDFKKAGVPEQALDDWLATLGWQALLNKLGSTWRKLPEAQRDAVQDSVGARAVMLAHSSVIKRPVLRWQDGSLTVGFDETLFLQKLP